MYRICLFLFANLNILVCYSQQTEIDVVGISGNHIANTDLNLNNTTGELVISTISNTDLILTQGFQQTTQLVTIQPKVLLQGAMMGSSDNLMRDDLRSGNYIPETSPYDNTTRVSNATLAVTGNDAVVDWVTVKLLDSNSNVVSEKSALVQRDGDVVSSDGISPVQFNTFNNNYRVQVNHRNHLGATTNDIMSLRYSPTNLNFTNGSLTTYGTFAQNEISPSLYALWAGNANGDNRTRYQGSGNDTNFIKDQVRFNINNPSNSNFFVYFDYSNADINMDGRIRYQGSNNDTNIIKDIVRSHPNNPALSNFFLILEQTPN